ncbi:MAG: PKD domain-containing protein [Methanoregula sp.]|jgi:PKD repeat protein
MKYSSHCRHGSSGDRAVSEIVGSIMLISVVVIAVSVIGVVLLSQPTPTNLPSLDAVISADTGHNMIHIYHDGGDLMTAENIQILVDGIPTQFTKSGSSGWTTWSAGESLDAPYTGSTPPTVQIVYTGGGGSTVLVSANFAPGIGQGGSPTLTPSPTATTPVPTAPVVANFTGTPTLGPVPLTVTFADASSGPVISWSWTFGDGGISALQNPSHQYGTAGNYTVSLTVSNGTATDTRTRTNYISASTPVAPVVAGFTGAPTTGAAPLLVQFTDASTGPVTSWAWNFGDGGTANVQNPAPHTYVNAGNYTVSLVVYNGTGSNTLTRTNYIAVTVSAPPVVANFTGTPVTGTRPLTVQFTDASTGSPISRSWNFGDTGTSTATNPSHQYINAGTYTVNLTVSNGTGTNTLTRTNYIVVNPPAPVADFTGTPTSGNRPLTVQFADASSNNPTSWAWDFGDGTTSVSQNPSKTYASGGTYTVALTATNAGGSNTITKTGYITAIIPASSVTLNAAKPGYLLSGGYIQFTVRGGNAHVIHGGTRYDFNNNDIVRLTINSDPQGLIYSSGSSITSFGFDDVGLMINGVDKGRNTISEIYINNLDTFSSTLTLNVPSQSAWTQLIADGITIINGDSSALIRLYSLGDTSPTMNLDNRATTYYVGTVSGYTIT